MIRAQRPADRERVLALWLASTTAGHPFIRPDYWRASLPIVRDVYLPGACTWVEEENDALRGFISVMHEKFIGALFVAPHGREKASAPPCSRMCSRSTTR